MRGRQLAVMAAVLGISNCGQDSLFRGPRPLVTPLRMQQYPEDVTAESVAWDLCRLFCETEEVAHYHIDEVKSWVRTLRNKSPEYVRRTWPDLAQFLEV